MKKYVLCIIWGLSVWCAAVRLSALDLSQALSVRCGPNRQTGSKKTELNADAVYALSSRWFTVCGGASVDAETLHLSLCALGSAGFELPWFCAGAGAGLLYHDLWMYDILFEQDIAFMAGGHAGCPASGTRLYYIMYWGQKRSTVYAVRSACPVMTDYLVNYDAGIAQDILRTSWRLGVATWSFFRHDLRYIPELYLYGKVRIVPAVSCIASVQVLFSDMSNKTCHPEYVFCKAGIEWQF